MRCSIVRAASIVAAALLVSGLASGAVAQGIAGSQTLSLPSGTQQMAAPQAASQPTGTAKPDAAGGTVGSADILNTTNKVKFEVSIMAGIGGKSIDVGTTTSGDQVKVSGGGGAGIALTAGYGLSEHLEFDLSLGGQTSTERPAVENANATFSRGFFRATLKYLVPVRDRVRFKFGGGVGSYGGGELDIDTTRVPGGSRDVVKYDNASGGHLVGEFEALIRNDITFVAGLRLYSVKYKANTWEHNGAAAPVASLPNNVRNLDGSGTDLFIGIAIYR